MKREKFIEILWFVVILALFFVSIKFLRNGELQSQVEALGIFAPLLILILKMSTLVVAPLGGTPIYVLSGALFGSFKGFILVLLGDILGSSICFYLSKIYGQRVLKFFAGSKNVEKVLKTVNIISNTRSFIKARFVFVSMPELLAYASGLSKINFWTFTIINAIFYAPIDLILVFFGSQLVTLPLKYFFLYPLILMFFAFGGFMALYKDYESREELLQDEKEKSV